MTEDKFRQKIVRVVQENNLIEMLVDLVPFEELKTQFEYYWDE